MNSRRILAWFRRIDCRLCGQWRRVDTCRVGVCPECQQIVQQWHQDCGDTVCVPMPNRHAIVQQARSGASERMIWTVK